MSRGFTLIELVITMAVLSILGAFTFSVVWQYSQLYADTKGGYVYGEAAAVLERMSRELKDAGLVDPLGANPATYINFLPTHGTPATTPATGGFFPPPQWVQYCTCAPGGRTYLYRVQDTSQNATNQCQPTTCPSGPNAKLMSRNIMSSGFLVTLPAVDSYVITLKLASDGSANNSSITLVTRVSPRNYTGSSTGRSFSGGYYDEIN